MNISRRAFSAMALAASLTVTAAMPGHAQDAKKMGIMIYNLGIDPWMNVAVKTLQDEARARGYEVTVADGRNDVGQMSAAIDQFVIQGMDAIIIAPSDPDSLVGSVSSAVAKGVPVVAFSLGLSDEANLTSFVTADEKKMGAEQAELVVEAIGGKGNVAIMTGILGTTPQLGRSDGEHSVFSQHPDIKIVEEQANDWAHDKTVALIQNWLSKYPKGELNAVLAHGPEIVAAAEYAKSHGRDEVKFVGIDYPEDARQAILDGTLLGTINQDPALLAKLAVENADKAVNGEPVEKLIIIDTPVITAENANDHPAAY